MKSLLSPVALGVIAFAPLSAAIAVADDQPTTKSNAAGDSIAARYAQTYLDLAQANLEKADGLNRKVPGTIPEALLEGYRQNVAIGKLQLQLAKSGKTQNDFGLFLQLARTSASQAEANWKRAQIVKQRTPDLISDLDLKRHRLRAELAGLNLEAGEAVADGPADAQMRWKLHLLYDEVARLSEVVQRLGQRD